MLKKIDKFSILSILLSIAIVLTAITASVACTEGDISCAELGGYELRLTDTVQDIDSTTFKYDLIAVSTSKNVSILDMLVPVCSDDNDLYNSETGQPSGWEVYLPGEGSPSTSYGEGVYQYYVFEQNFNSPGTVYLKTPKASVGPTSVAAKIGTKLETDKILGPDCFNAKTASVTEQTVQLDLFKDPDRIMNISQDPSGALLSVSAYDGSGYVPVPVKDLKTFPVWVCVNPVLDSNGDFLRCDPIIGDPDGMLPITYMPDGVGRFGKNTCYAAFIAGRYAYYCY